MGSFTVNTIAKLLAIRSRKNYTRKKEVQTLRRNTTQRMAIEQVFKEQERPLGVEEVHAFGRKIVKSLNQATVYRNLKILVHDGWLKRITHPLLGTLYERTGKDHHHHFHCRTCNRAFELPGCVLKENEIAPTGFVVEDHEIYLFGVCPSCGA
ncbi:MAG: Zinc uptake regulation protein [Syntrophorhabdus sp. PtaU1.Bin153]|nr:MAG: Zinc uptake regulation protein [Syntrophorhabdus sp. PtaU1.Bin153]